MVHPPLGVAVLRFRRQGIVRVGAVSLLMIYANVLAKVVKTRESHLASRLSMWTKYGNLNHGS